MKIYIDVVIIENFIVDLFILLVTAKALKIRVNKIRILIGALLGGIYSVVMLFPQMKLFSTIPFQIVLCLFIIFVSFNKTGFVNIIKGAGIYIIFSIILSGMCYLFILIQSDYSLNKPLVLGQNTVKNIILSMIIIYFLTNKIIAYIKERTIVNNLIYDIDFEINGQSYHIKGFLDTGNGLIEPTTNLPCILVEAKYINLDETRKDSLYYIPYNAIGVRGVLKGIKVDKVTIKSQGSIWRKVTAIICPCQEQLSKNEEYSALLSRGII